MIHVQRIQDERQFEALRHDWNALLSESASDNFFLRWEWLHAWWKIYKEDNQELCILLIFNDGRLHGIAPFYLRSYAWKKLYQIRRLMFLGTKEKSVISEYMDIICKTGEEDAVLEEIVSFIHEQDLCDDIDLHMIDAGSRSISFLKRTAEKMQYYYEEDNRRVSPCLKLPVTYADHLSGLSGTLRYKIQRDKRRLAKYPNVDFRKTTDSGQLEHDYAELVRLHQLRWEARHMTGSFAGGKFYHFLKMVMPEMLQNGHLELRFLNIEGKSVAALCNIKYKGKIYFFQAGLDIVFDKRIAPGLLLHDHAIHEAIQDGLSEYDFLLMGNTDAYKKQLTNEERSLCDVRIGRTIKAKLGMMANRGIGKLYHAGKTVRAALRQGQAALARLHTYYYPQSDPLEKAAQSSARVLTQ